MSTVETALRRIGLEHRQWHLLLIWLICLQLSSIGGVISIVTSYATFGVLLLFLERSVRPFALLAFANMVFNYVGHVYGVRGAGFIILVPIVGVLLSPFWRRACSLLMGVPVRIRYTAGSLMTWWLISWLSGPRTEYATLRFVEVTCQLILGPAALAWCLADGESGLMKAGMLGLVAMTIQTCINSQYYPLSILTLGAWRSDLAVNIEDTIGPRLLGMAALLIFSYCLRMSRFPWLLYVLTLLCIAIPVFAADSRQTYLGLVAGCLGFLSDQVTRRRAILTVAVIIGATVAIFLGAIGLGNARYTVLVDPDMGFLERTGRQYHLQAGVDTWLRSPIVGVGMGGFESIRDDIPQGKSYPHNVILEMLAETGLVGCLLGVSVIALCLAQIYRYPTVYLSYWNQLLPIWLYALVLAMVSLDIAQNAPVFYYPLSVIMAGSLPHGAKAHSPLLRASHGVGCGKA